MKKYIIQPCETGGSIYGKRRTAQHKKRGFENKCVARKELADVYNTFYKKQVEALYKAINHDK